MCLPAGDVWEGGPQLGRHAVAEHQQQAGGEVVHEGRKEKGEKKMKVKKGRRKNRFSEKEGNRGAK